MKTYDKQRILRILDGVYTVDDDLKDFGKFMNTAYGDGVKAHNYEACVKAAKEIPRYQYYSDTVKKYFDKSENAYKDYVAFVKRVIMPLAQEAEKLYDDSDGGSDVDMVRKSKFGKMIGSYRLKTLANVRKVEESLKMAEQFRDKAYEAHEDAKKRIRPTK